MKISIIKSCSEHLKYSQVIMELIFIEAEKKNMIEWAKEDIEKMITSGMSVIAIYGDEAIGFCGCWEWENYLEIAALIVDSNHRKHGIGTALFEELLNIAKSRVGKKEIIVMPNTLSARIAHHYNFFNKQKKYFNEEVWKACRTCREYENFPCCHCEPAVYQAKEDAE